MTILYFFAQEFECEGAVEVEKQFPFFVAPFFPLVNALLAVRRALTLAAPCTLGFEA